jgi:formimidoylglutamate deiminase
LFAAAVGGGAQALGRPAGALAIGRSADIVVLDDAHPDLATASGDQWLDGWIFVAGRAAVGEVFVAGKRVTSGGRHLRHDEIATRYRATLKRLIAD